ncbi:sialate O-acetylesterase [Undibacterium sp. Rencai35W]|uniref:sialate O-acetylesterase n=1 Tax=Undibacterium sp. Rencai35W TaxID=3413046 RepID=UPI003BF141FE
MGVLRNQRVEPLALTADALNTGIVSAYSWASEDASTATSNGKDHSGNARDWTVSGNGAPPIVSTAVGNGRDPSNVKTVHNRYYTAASASSIGLNVGTGAFSLYRRIRMPSVAAATTAIRSIGRITHGSSTPLTITVYEVAGTGWCWYPFFDDGTTKLNWNDVGNPANAANKDSMLHITRSASGTVKFYVDGVLIKTQTGNAVNFLSTAGQVTIAGLYDNAGGAEPDFIMLDDIHWSRELTGTEVAAHAANPYAYYSNTAPVDSIAVTTPANGASVGVNIPIAGSFSGGNAPDYIEASFNGGAFANIGGTLGGGNFSGTLSGQTPGTGNLVVRWHNFPAVTQTITGVTVTADSITFSIPDHATCVKANRGFQRNSQNKAVVRVAGTYTGTPTSLQWQWCGGSWNTLVASPSGGTFDATVTLPNIDHGTFSVRFSNNTAVLSSINDVGVGDVGMVFGQSQNVGKANTYIAWVAPAAHPNWKSTEFDKSNNWVVNQETASNQFSKEYASPYATYAAGGLPQGSYFGELARMVMAVGVPLYLVPCAVGSTSLASWGVNTALNTYYGIALDRANKLGATGHKFVLWWQGENDANDTTTQTAYTNGLNAIINDWVSRFPGVKWLLANINNIVDGGGTYPNFTPIHNAIAAVAAGNTNVVGIADMSGAWSSPNTHFGQGAGTEITTVATRMFNAMNLAFYSRVVSLNIVDASGNPLTNITGINWAIYNEATPDQLAAPASKGSGAAINGAGLLTLAIPTISVAVGGTAWLEFSTSNGTTTQSPAARSFAGPVVVN